MDTSTNLRTLHGADCKLGDKSKHYRFQDFFSWFWSSVPKKYCWISSSPGSHKIIMLQLVLWPNKVSSLFGRVWKHETNNSYRWSAAPLPPGSPCYIIMMYGSRLGMQIYDKYNIRNIGHFISKSNFSNKYSFSLTILDENERSTYIVLKVSVIFNHAGPGAPVLFRATLMQCHPHFSIPSHILYEICSVCIE